MLNDFGEVLFDANLTNYNTYGINTSAKYFCCFFCKGT